MNATPLTLPSPRDVLRILATHKRHWLIPALLITAAAVAYAAVRKPSWEASQALIVRNEAANNETGLGKFSETGEMKTVQETILELVRSRGVLAPALEEVGPPTDYKQAVTAWPTPRDVAKVRDAVKLTPPKGAEFGETEVFYLNVRDHSRDRAEALTGAICSRLQARLQRLRDTKAHSMIDELTNAAQVAQTDLDESTERLIETERQVGSDLAELRVLNDAGSGESALRRTIAEIRGELRETAATHTGNQQLLDLLKGAKDDPGQLVATPNRLLVSQPALRRLKDGLVDAQLRTAALQGNMSTEHPLVRAAKLSEDEIGRHLHDELAIAVRGLEVELHLSGDRMTMLQQQLDNATGRLDRLAAVRATYANQVAQNSNRSELLKRAEENLGEARAALASANASSLIARIDAPQAGLYPVGPSRSMIALAGLVGGLLIGFGTLFLTAQPATPTQSATPAQPAMPERIIQPRPVDLNLPVRPRTEATEPAEAPLSGLSIHRALEKIDYASRA
ncbi:MAG: hypothetical protein HQ567_08870 [Candidatus Nealsonbacteria bacterium]|nr:hypothetical protein [Candidatus Nealsonbacteria bacterium]